MSDPYELLPAFVSPLSDVEHARIGRIAVLWGHADFFLDEIILKVLRLTREQRKLLIGEKPMGPKLDILKPAIAGIKSDDVRRRVQEFYNILNNTKAKRNHIFHGAWGFRVHVRTKKVAPGARHHKNPTNPVEVQHLAPLERELCRASRLGADAFSLLRSPKRNAVGGITRFFHGFPKKPPKWFERWLTQHPVDVASWGHSSKIGELPRPLSLDR